MSRLALPRWSLIVALAVLTLAAAVASLLVGAVDLSVARLIAAAAGDGDKIASVILFDLRLPRTLLALAVGAMLGLAGAALQGYLRNPLAEPSVLGTSNAAALGGVAAIYFGLADIHPVVLPLLATGGALISLALLFVLAGKAESPLTLILAGIAVGTLAVAGTSLALNLSPNPFAAMEIMTWLLGSLENRSFDHVWIALPCIAIGTAIGVGGAVAVSGAIGFIGLIVPHLIRPLTDRSPSAILLPSAIGGAALLTLADLGVRIIPTTNELKLGVVTAFLGVPVFLVHLMRERRIW